MYISVVGVNSRNGCTGVLCSFETCTQGYCSAACVCVNIGELMRCDAVMCVT